VLHENVNQQLKSAMDSDMKSKTQYRYIVVMYCTHC